MEKDEFIRFLENKGINAKLEDGVVMILYDGGTLSPSEVYRKFNLAKKFAEENEYRGSLGIRKRKDNLNPVSSIIDQVSVIDATGAAAFEEAYVKSEPTAAEREDGSAGTATDPVFRVAKLKPELINVTSFVSKNIQRVSPLAYEAKIRSLALKALRRKVAKMIVNGSTDSFGIKTAKNTMNEDICKELLLDANTIDANTVKLMFGTVRLELTKKLNRRLKS